MNVENKNIVCTNFTRSVDDIVKYYKHTWKEIVQSLKNDPVKLSKELWTKYLNVDTTCECSMGTSQPENIIKSNYKCMQCVNLGRVAILGTELLNTPFKLCAGSFQGNYWVITQFKNSYPFIEIQENYKYSAEYITQYYNKLNVCDSNLQFNKYLTSDPLTHCYLIGQILSELTVNTVQTYTAFVCCNDGYLLCENDVTLNEFIGGVENTGVFATQCLQQLVHTFGSLLSHNFTHNNVSTHSLQFSENAYTSGKHKHNFTLKIGDFQNSCIDSNGCRLYNYETYSEMHIGDLPIITTTESKLVDLTTNGTFSVYKFNYETGKKIMHLRRLGINLYSSSLDLYCYLIVVSSNKTFWNAVVSDSKLYNVWKSVWNAGELEVVHARINKLQDHKNVDVWDCMRTLSGLSLRCDLYSHLNSQL